jgi:curved DNA-binding protein CbpA
MAPKKDYYRILHIKPSATGEEIKIAYRKLAKQYHPDRNPGDSLAAAEFANIAEAYSVLSDEESRKQYNYSRHLTAPGEYQRPAEQIETLINRVNEANKYLRFVNEAHFNKDTLFYSILGVLPEDIDLLAGANAAKLKTFLEKILEAALHLNSFQTKKLEQHLQPLLATNEWFQKSMEAIIQRQKKSEQWDKYKVILAVVLAILLCFIIFYEGGR